MAYVLLTNPIITSALNATITLNIRSSMLLALEIGLRFGFVVNLGYLCWDQDGSCERKNISVRNEIWLWSEILDLPHINAA